MEWGRRTIRMQREEKAIFETLLMCIKAKHRRGGRRIVRNRGP